VGNADVRRVMGAASEIPPPVIRRADEGRKLGRIRLHLVSSNLGHVENVSATGAQLMCRGFLAPVAVRDAISLVIEGLDGPIRITARAIWVKRRGLLQHLVGVEFCEPDAAARRGLIDLVRRAPMNDIYARCEDLRRSA
jgi:hypothetical protein